MSYDIYLTVPRTGDTLKLAAAHTLTGGTYAAGGTREAWLNITYNYGAAFRRVLGEKGIRAIYGMAVEDALPLLEQAERKLTGEPDPDYWAATDGNAKKALQDLIALAKLCPAEAVFDGD